jgi:hypothetical protein
MGAIKTLAAILDFNMATGSVDTMEWFPYDFPGF